MVNSPVQRGWPAPNLFMIIHLEIVATVSDNHIAHMFLVTVVESPLPEGNTFTMHPKLKSSIIGSLIPDVQLHATIPLNRRLEIGDSVRITEHAPEPPGSCLLLARLFCTVLLDGSLLARKIPLQSPHYSSQPPFTLQKQEKLIYFCWAHLADRCRCDIDAFLNDYQVHIPRHHKTGSCRMWKVASGDA